MGNQPIQQDRGIVSPCDSCRYCVPPLDKSGSLGACVLTEPRLALARLDGGGGLGSRLRCRSSPRFIKRKAVPTPLCHLYSVVYRYRLKGVGRAFPPGSNERAGGGGGESIKAPEPQASPSVLVPEKSRRFLTTGGCTSCPITGWPSDCCRNGT